MASKLRLWALCMFGTVSLLSLTTCATADEGPDGNDTPFPETEESAFTYKLGPRIQECFYMDALQGDHIEIEFQVVTGGNLDVDYNIRGPNGQAIEGGGRRTDALWEGVAERNGAYELCLSNSFSSVTAKEVFVLMVRDRPPEDRRQGMEGKNGVDAGKEEGALMTVNAISSRVHTLLQKATTVQDHLRVRERRHRLTAENNLWRVANWSLFQMIIIVVVAFVQVVAVRRFFKDTGKPGV